MSNTMTIAPAHEMQLDVPAGMRLQKTLQGHGDWINRLAWDPDGSMIATPSNDKTVRIWDAETGECRHCLAHDRIVISVAWSPDRSMLATSSEDWRIRLYDTHTWNQFHELIGHENWVVGLAWSPDGKHLASCSDDRSIAIWDTSSWKCVAGLKKPHSELRDNVFSVAWSPDSRWLASAHGDDCIRIWNPTSGECRILGGHQDQVLCVAWFPRQDSHPTVVSGSVDHTIRVWNTETGLQTQVLEVHTGDVRAVCFSPEGSLLASKSADHTVRLWWRGHEGWKPVARFHEPCGGAWLPGLAFHPELPRLASLGDVDRMVRIWDLDVDVLSGLAGTEPATCYKYAKVVLAGDTGVGKTALGLVLAGEDFRATESTHMTNVFELGTSELPAQNGHCEERHVLLWDLGGQPMYRVVNRIRLQDTAVALVLFDSRSEIDPFAGVAYWARALDEANRGRQLKKYLVAARTDRGGVQASKARIREAVRRYGFSGYFETSAKGDFGIRELQQQILSAIPWKELPVIASAQLITEIKRFLMLLRAPSERNALVLATLDDLHARFRRIAPWLEVSKEVFAECLEGLQRAGVVHRLSFGNHVLLRPKILDDYCAWLVMAARDQPDGLGYIAEDAIRQGNFRMDSDRPLAGKPEDEATMLLATVQEVVGRNIANRQETQLGPMLVFPSEIASDVPDYPGGYELAVAYRFEGPVKAIYATLAVTLINSITFTRRILYKNAALFDAAEQQLCGFAVEYPDRDNDSMGRLTVFFGKDTSHEVRLLFLRYVNRHLERMAYEASVKRVRVYQCAQCHYTIPAEAVEKATSLGRTCIGCPVCFAVYPIDNLAEQSALEDKNSLDRIDTEAQHEQQCQQRLAVLDKIAELRAYHVFLCHNSRDKVEVRRLAEKLKRRGVLPWIDERAIRPGELFAAEMERALDVIPAIAVILGPCGQGPWQEMEYYVAIQRYVDDRRNKPGQRKVRIIPVLLPGVAEAPELPAFLRTLNYVDLRQGYERDEMQKLVDALLDGSGHGCPS